MNLIAAIRITWMDYEALNIELAELELQTILDKPRLEVLWKESVDRAYNQACMAEVGVFQGGSAFYISKALLSMKSSVTFFCIDTFTGIPKTSQKDNFHSVGDFSNVSYERVKKGLESLRPENKVIQGNINEVRHLMENEVFSLVHIDVDVYPSVIDCCGFFWPRMIDGGIIIFDDYYAPSCLGAKAGVDEFFKSSAHFIDGGPPQLLVKKEIFK